MTPEDRLRQIHREAQKAVLAAQGWTQPLPIDTEETLQLMQNQKADVLSNTNNTPVYA